MLGAGLAWAAEVLGHQAVIYLPKGAAASRVAKIESYGAKAIVTDLSYDEAVALSAKKADEEGWVLIQDTAWKGYTEVCTTPKGRNIYADLSNFFVQVPRNIMAGYKLIAHEALEALKKEELTTGGEITHVVLQAQLVCKLT